MTIRFGSKLWLNEILSFIVTWWHSGSGRQKLDKFSPSYRHVNCLVVHHHKLHPSISILNLLWRGMQANASPVTPQAILSCFLRRSSVIYLWSSKLWIFSWEGPLYSHIRSTKDNNTWSRIFSSDRGMLVPCEAQICVFRGNISVHRFSCDGLEPRPIFSHIAVRAKHPASGAIQWHV